MYAHHKESLDKALEYFKTQSRVKDGLIAVFFGGSVAKGCERPDSDLDFMVIVTDEVHEKLKEQDCTVETVGGYCTYPEGYFDIKYYTKDFLKAVKNKGSEPARNAWVKAQCLYTVDPELPLLAAEISRFPEELYEDKMLSLYGYFTLNEGYFWHMGKHDKFLRVRAASDTIFYGLRMILQENRILFPCAKGLYAAIAAAPNKPQGILELADKVLNTLSDEDMDAFVSAVKGFLTWKLPPWHEAGTRYTNDNELWWNEPRPLVSEW